MNNLWTQEELSLIEKIENVPRETLYRWLVDQISLRPRINQKSAIKIFLAVCEVENDYSQVELQIRNYSGRFKGVLAIQGQEPWVGWNLNEINYPTKEAREAKVKLELEEILHYNYSPGLMDYHTYSEVFGNILKHIPTQEYPF